MSLSENNFESVFLGASPGMLLEAILAARKQNNVAVIIPENNLGGAWAGVQALGETELESAPHFFQSAVDLSFLSKDINLNLMPVPKTEWFLLIKGKFFLKANDRWAKFIVQLITIRSKLMNIAKKNFSKVHDDRSYNLKAAIAELFFLLGKYQESREYFRQGCVRFNHQLLELAQKNKVQLISGRAIELEKTHNGLSLKLKDQSKVYCQKLKITRRSVLETWYSKAQSYIPELIPVVRHQFHWRVSFVKPNPIYLRRSYGCGFFALADLSMIENSQVKGLERIMTITHANMSPDFDGLKFDVQRYFEELIQFGVLPQGTKLLESHYSTYHDHRMKDHDYAALVDQIPEVEILGDIDFSVWLKSLKKRWLSC